MDWFKKLTGCQETTYADTCRMLMVEGGQLHSLVNDRSYGIGALLNKSELGKRTTVICHFLDFHRHGHAKIGHNEAW